MSIGAQTCWGLRGPHYIYGGKSYGIDALLFEPHPENLWYPELHLEACYSLEGNVTIVKGVFKHNSCRRVFEFAEPFPNLTCDICQSVVSDCDFRSRVLYEECAIGKHGSRGTSLGRQACYLFVFELSGHFRLLTEKIETEQM